MTAITTTSHKKFDTNSCFWHLGQVTNSIAEISTTGQSPQNSIFYNYMRWNVSDIKLVTAPKCQKQLLYQPVSVEVVVYHVKFL
jgi:hypothetical protein